MVLFMNDYPICEVFPRIDAEGTVVTIHPPLDDVELVALQAELGKTDDWDATWQPATVEETDRRQGLHPMTPHTLIRLSSEGPGFHAKSNALGIASRIGHALTCQHKD